MEGLVTTAPSATTVRRADAGRTMALAATPEIDMSAMMAPGADRNKSLVPGW